MKVLSVFQKRRKRKTETNIENFLVLKLITQLYFWLSIFNLTEPK